MHVPVEQYGFIGITDFEGSVEDAVQKYKEIQEAVKPQPISDVTSKEWIELYDKVAAGIPIQGDPGVLSQLNPFQRFALNEAKKRVKRLNN